MLRYCCRDESSASLLESISLRLLRLSKKELKTFLKPSSTGPSHRFCQLDQMFTQIYGEYLTKVGVYPTSWGKHLTRIGVHLTWGGEHSTIALWITRLSSLLLRKLAHFCTCHVADSCCRAEKLVVRTVGDYLTWFRGCRMAFSGVN